MTILVVLIPVLSACSSPNHPRYAVDAPSKTVYPTNDAKTFGVSPNIFDTDWSEVQFKTDGGDFVVKNDQYTNIFYDAVIGKEYITIIENTLVDGQTVNQYNVHLKGREFFDAFNQLFGTDARTYHPANDATTFDVPPEAYSSTKDGPEQTFMFHTDAGDIEVSSKHFTQEFDLRPGDVESLNSIAATYNEEQSTFYTAHFLETNKQP